MGMTANDYLRQLQSLLPQGQAWPRDAEATLTQLLAALAEEFARVDRRGEDLINEADPRNTSDLLTDWERIAGLPDTCLTAGQTVEQRRAALVSKLTSLGGQSRQYFINIAAALGYPGATIDEFRPMNCNDDCNDAVASEADRFAWRINLPSLGGAIVMNCNSTCNDALQAWGDEVIECRINHFKPAHTTAIFAYV
ncbi:YmfQ family protein [Nitrosospira sp. NpAV]|uniref:YmfQ family protein n=1 Tax=Nitrosospira sp. NpAV TaxID=58133 RepID=UPI0005A237CB|nr:putative phage tail protein [Nitrosospira sp. NpAV]KIO49589.1 hypothetical protein SQ11_05530 [Nitrosospira sp. NpAV]